MDKEMEAYEILCTNQESAGETGIGVPATGSSSSDRIFIRNHIN
jgi:hypothetical protein